MIARIRDYFFLGARSLLSHRALLVPLLLIVLVPLAFLWSGQRFLDISKERAERLEKDRIGIIHDAIALLLQTNALEAGLLTPELESFKANNPDITTIEILRYDVGTTTVVVRIGDEMSPSYQDEERLATLRIDESIIFEEYRGSQRHWVGFRAVADERGVVTHLIRTDLSMAAVDRYIASRLSDAYAVLALLVFAIIALIWRQVRIIDYARLYGELKAAHSTMSLFVNMTAHELRTPLTAIKGYASMIREEPEAIQKHGEYATRIEDSSSDLILLITDLLDLARLQSGQMSFTTAPTELSSIITHVSTLLMPLAAKSNLSLTVEPDLLVSSTILGDEKRLTQALTNVVSNALKYTKEGGVSIGLTYVGNEFEIRVKDTGTGIAAEDQKKLFAPYFRVESPDVAAKTGTGLGMWITKRMIEEMKGTIDVESIKGVGTHIVVRFKKA